MPRIHRGMLVALLMCSALAWTIAPEARAADEGRPVAGWRGNWTGLFPDANPPTQWRRVSKVMAGLRCSAAEPKDEAPAGSPAFLGAVPEWMILGPLPGGEPATRSIDDPIVPDEANLQGQEGVKVGGAAWRLLRTDQSMVDLAARFGNDARGVAFASTNLYAPVEGTVLFRFLHSTKGLKAYLNGKLIYPTKEPPVLTLGKGWNHLVCKVAWGSAGVPYPSAWYLGVLITGVLPYETESKNIAWATRLPDMSTASPLIVGGRIFTLSEPGDLICLDKKDGRILWLRSNTFFDSLTDAEKKSDPFKEVAALARELERVNGLFLGQWPGDARSLEKRDLERQIDALMRKIDRQKYGRKLAELHGRCLPTPCTDGQFVYLFLGDGTAACYDLEGNRKWTTLIPNEIKHHGYNASPILAGGKLVVFMREMLGLDRETGRIDWRMDLCGEPYYEHTHESPVGFTVRGEDLLYAYGQVVRARDGKVLALNKGWRDNAFIPTPVVAGGYIYHISVAGLRKIKLPTTTDAIELKSESDYRLWGGWDVGKRTFLAASPLCHDGLLYFVDVMGMLRVLDVETSALVYQRDLGLGLEVGSRIHPNGIVYASPFLAGGRIYAFGMNGTSVVFEPGRQYKEVARNKIEFVTNPGTQSYYERPEGFSSTPIPEGNRIYVRGDEYLYCIEAQAPAGDGR